MTLYSLSPKHNSYWYFKIMSELHISLMSAVFLIICNKLFNNTSHTPLILLRLVRDLKLWLVHGYASELKFRTDIAVRYAIRLS